MREILFRGKGDKKYNDGMWYFGVPIRCYDGAGRFAPIIAKGR